MNDVETRDTLNGRFWENAAMEYVCSVCTKTIRDDDYNTVVLKVKGARDAFVRYHWRCWVDYARFWVHDIDFDYTLQQLEESIQRSIRK